MNFILTSDIHANGTTIRSDKISDTKLLKDYYDKVDLIIIAGDLLDTGANGEDDLQIVNNCVCIGHHKNELKSYIDFLNEIDTNWFNSSKIYMCLGNHDTYTDSLKTKLFRFFHCGKYPPNTIQGLLEQKYGGQLYSFVKKGITFLCLGIYPDHNAIIFLREELKKSLHCDPIILFFHYPLTGPYSDWWKDEERVRFYETIKGKNIICICVGHYHDTYITTWNDIPVISGAGSNTFIKGSFDDTGIKFDIIHSTNDL